MAPIRVNTPFFGGRCRRRQYQKRWRVGGERRGGEAAACVLYSRLSACLCLSTILAYGRLVLLPARLTVSPSISICRSVCRYGEEEIARGMGGSGFPRVVGELREPREPREGAIVIVIAL